MTASTAWWVLTGVLVAAELGTGTFYLLMLALGAAAGAVAAHLGFAPTGQIAVGAIVGSLCTVAWYVRRRGSAQEPVIEANRDVNLDVGETVQVAQWDAQGCTQIHYRGALWTARFTGNTAPLPGPHRIVALRGNVLELQTA
ncbi:NfeD family protein [Inhella gelatinilytica]|uniref:NfeD family protein n=1 Tax=Inhella gelatinilytica TaxID=2795030 RepID=A0A931IZ32_9BURK|nr:NfeD family protein [Inhella gelatinilytica]MBH9554246.1 NfeD family protein [Inhella gelatinilytica]